MVTRFVLVVNETSVSYCYLECPFIYNSGNTWFFHSLSVLTLTFLRDVCCCCRCLRWEKLNKMLLYQDINIYLDTVKVKKMTKHCSIVVFRLFWQTIAASKILIKIRCCRRRRRWQNIMVKENKLREMKMFSFNNAEQEILSRTSKVGLSYFMSSSLVTRI